MARHSAARLDQFSSNWFIFEVDGESARDVAANFIQRWNFSLKCVKKLKNVQSAKPYFLIPELTSVPHPALLTTPEEAGYPNVQCQVLRFVP